MENLDVKILSTELSLGSVQSFIESHKFGAQVIFVGTVRNATKGKRVKFLEFESYISMAIKEMEKIGLEILKNDEIGKVSIHHRLGKLELGEVPVIIGISAPHRAVAFKACEYAINTLKETVPIWKKEFFTDGAIWVSATP